MTLPGPGDDPGAHACLGGACPHDHPEPPDCDVCGNDVGFLPEPGETPPWLCQDCLTVWCELCDEQIDAADPNGTGPALCADCESCAVCGAAIEILPDFDAWCSSCEGEVVV